MRVCSLAYADDVVLLVKDEDGMRGLMGKLEKYLNGKNLKVNMEKTKVMRCRRGEGRRKKVNWRWKGKIAEEVNSFKYLGYTLTANGRQEAHVEERVRKGAAILGQVWGIVKGSSGGIGGGGCGYLIDWCGRLCVTGWRFGVGRGETKLKGYKKDI